MNHLNRAALLTTIAVAIAACSSDYSFNEKSCVATESETLTIVFSSEEAIRTLSINAKSNDITFKGTTLNDGKWRTELSKINRLAINKGNLIRAEFKDGKQFYFGTVSEKCKKLAGEKLGELLQIE
nr:hypothetical protein [uncultured Undibacterium sp.]